MSGHTKHVEGKHWQFIRWHLYDPLETEAKEDAITFFCYDIDKVKPHFITENAVRPLSQAKVCVS